MIQCPNCKNTLPDWAQKCQFCQTDVSKLPRAAGASKVSASGGSLSSTPKWIWPLYYALSIWWIIGGAISVAQAFVGNKGEMGVEDGFGIAFGAIRILVGLGLAFQVEIIRGFVNVISFISLIFSVLGLLSSLASILVFGPLGLLFVVSSILDILVAGTTIWIIGETRSRAPNI